MKVIAYSPSPYADSKFIVELTKTEAGHLIGHEIVSNADIERLIGREIKISEKWNLIKAHRESVDKLKQAAKTLRALADLCEQQEPQITITEGNEEVQP